MPELRITLALSRRPLRVRLRIDRGRPKIITRRPRRPILDARTPPATPRVTAGNAGSPS